MMTRRQTMRKLNQEGVAHLGLILVVTLAIAVVIFAFWRIQTQEDAPATQPTTSEEGEVEPIQDASELEAIQRDLEATDIDGELDAGELDEVLE